LRTIFRLSLLVFVLFFGRQGFDFGEAYGVVDGVADAFEGDDEEDSGAEPEPAVIYAVGHD
jgi:hypothetical protein